MINPIENVQQPFVFNNEAGVRLYQFDNNTFPSVTTVIKHGSESDYDVFGKWKESLFKKHKAKIAQNKFDLPTKIGNFVHARVEDYLLKNETDQKIERTLAKHLVPFLDSIDNVIGVEMPLYSKRGYAGRADAVVEKDGKVYVVDFKTSNQKRTKSNTKAYKCQCSAYCLALYEMYGIKADGIILAVVYKKTVGVRNPTRYDIIIETEIRPHLDRFLSCLERFNSKSEELNLDQAF